MSWIDKQNKSVLRLAPWLFTCFFVVLTIINPSFIDESLETLLVDYRFRVRNLIAPPEVPHDIVIVAIDEKSLTRYGRWPWSRNLQAKLIESIVGAKPKALAVDIFYAEPESSEADSALAAALREGWPITVLALSFEVTGANEVKGDKDLLFEHAIMRVDHSSFLNPIKAQRVLLPPSPIDTSAQLGHVYVLPDRDGKIRSEALYLQYGDDYIPALSLLAASIAKEIPFEEISIDGNRGIQLGSRFLVTDMFGRMYINYYGREGAFKYISAADLIDGQFDSDFLSDKIVLVGTSAIATYDQKSSPFSANMPGVEKNATVIANILNNNFLQKIPNYINLIIVLLVGVATLLVSFSFTALYSILAFFLLTGVLVFGNLFCFSQYRLLLNLTYPLSTIFSSGLFIIGYKYFIEEKSARQLKSMFSSYVTERIVNELIKNPEEAKLGGHRREVSIMFSDIRGFTSFSEKNEPEHVVAMLNEYLEAMTDIVFHWEGTLDKFVGDAIVVFWSAPLVQDDHAERAVRCSLHMMQRLNELKHKWRSEGREELDIGIGLNTGEVLVGNIGAEGKKMDYTVIGDHVNLCARVESLTKSYNTNLIITEHILAKISSLVEKGAFGHMVITELEQVTVKGKIKPVSIYEMRQSEKSTKSQIITKNHL